MRKAFIGLLLVLALTQPVYASRLEDLRPGESKPTEKNGYSGNGAPNMLDIDQAASASRETVGDTKWDITSRDTSISIDLNQGVTRFEVFYSASGLVPYIAFQTSDGDVYVSGKNSDNIISREGNQITGHSDLRYEVIYLVAPSSYKNVQVKISLDTKTHDFMMIKSKVPQGWEHFTQEYRTPPEKLIIWGFHNTENTISDLIAIAENTDIKPADNNLGSAPPPDPPEVDNTGFIVSLFVVAILGIGVMLVLNNFSKKRKEQEDLEKRVKKKNTASKKRKMDNDKSLDNVLDEFESEYEDDNFFSEVESMEGTDVAIPIEKKIAFKEPDENIVPKSFIGDKKRAEPKKDTNDGSVKEEEENNPSPAQASPSWL